MKQKKFLNAFLTLGILFTGVFLSSFRAFADTDGSELQIAQPEQLEIQLGTAWAGAEFQLRTDYGLYPALIPVGDDGVLRLEIGGSGRYILSCVNTGQAANVDHPEEISASLPLQSDQAFDPASPAGTAAPVSSPDANNVPAQTDAPLDEPASEREAADPSAETVSAFAGIPIKHILFFSIGLLVCICILIVLRVVSVREEAEDEFDEYDE